MDEFTSLIQMVMAQPPYPTSRTMVYVGPHADRLAMPASTGGIGAIWFETDRQVVYISDGTDWLYAAGYMIGTLAFTIPVGLGTPDRGFLFWETVYKHMWRWTGSVWQFASGDPGSGFIVAGVSAPSGGLWAACTGSAATVSQDDATTTSITTPDLRADGSGNGVFIQGGSGGTVLAATRATWEVTAKTGDENATHNHTVTLGAPSIGEAVQTYDWDATVVASNAHLHTATVGNESAVHQHPLTDALSQLKKFDEANGGLPRRIQLEWYLRR